MGSEYAVVESLSLEAMDDTEVSPVLRILRGLYLRNEKKIAGSSISTVEEYYARASLL